jgi:polyhydroxyalkanoate synthesis repressor PhaR
METARVIKKYANRRLYDASISRHVTVDDIRRLIVQGEKITVIDDKSGEDITRLVLLQVIAEQEHGGQPILSTQLLEKLIRCYGNSRQQSMARCLEKSVEGFSQESDATSAVTVNDAALTGEALQDETPKEVGTAPPA